jgi:hypothetical protein
LKTGQGIVAVATEEAAVATPVTSERRRTPSNERDIELDPSLSPIPKDPEYIEWETRHKIEWEARQKEERERKYAPPEYWNSLTKEDCEKLRQQREH